MKTPFWGCYYNSTKNFISLTILSKERQAFKQWSFLSELTGCINDNELNKL